MVDDALKFMRREVRRERRYDGIILDPPKYGRGPDGEVWELYRDLPELLALARRLLDDRSRFLVLTVYAIRLSALAIADWRRRRSPGSAARSPPARWRSARRRAAACCRRRSLCAGRGRC